MNPQLPITTVVTPWQHEHEPSGSHMTWASMWVCPSMNPGVTTWPSASISSRPRSSIRPTSAIPRPAIADVGPEPAQPRPVDHRPVADHHVVGHEAIAPASAELTTGRRRPAAAAAQPFSAVFRADAAENFAAVDAAIVIISPVAGFRPWRAWRLDAENAPNPGQRDLVAALHGLGHGVEQGGDDLLGRHLILARRSRHRRDQFGLVMGSPLVAEGSG